MEINTLGIKLKLCFEKTIFIAEHSTLLIADVHLGKITHFRKAGIGLPQEALKTDYRELNDVLEKYNPETVVLMGDLFHSNYNSAWEFFIEFIQVFSEKEFILVKGNHDIMPPHRYQAINLTLVDNYNLGGLIITHEPLDTVPHGKYNLYGHIHPGVVIKGPSKQSLRLPCFYFQKDRGVLPAFGRFTGLAIVKPKKGEEVYGIAGDNIVVILGKTD